MISTTIKFKQEEINSLRCGMIVQRLFKPNTWTGEWPIIILKTIMNNDEGCNHLKHTKTGFSKEIFFWKKQQNFSVIGTYSSLIEFLVLEVGTNNFKFRF